MRTSELMKDSVGLEDQKRVLDFNVDHGFKVVSPAPKWLLKQLKENRRREEEVTIE